MQPPSGMQASTSQGPSPKGKGHIVKLKNPNWRAESASGVEGDDKKESRDE